MSFDARSLYELLPAIYRIRDVERGEPLRALMAVIAEQVSVLQENLDQLYDDQFIETCAEWVVPYIGELIGARGLDPLPNARYSLRAQVANTLGYRRRKGTAVVLEQLAHDVTGWHSHAVEFFQLLTCTQHMNHVRPGNTMSPDLRNWAPLQYSNTPFDSAPHLPDVRRIASERGKYNIPDVGIFLWRRRDFRMVDSPAVKLGTAGRRYYFNPFAIDTPLLTRPRVEERFTHLAGPLDVPLAIQPALLSEFTQDYYGEEKSLLITVGTHQVLPTELVVCDLTGGGANWGVTPQPDRYSVDPTRGRLVLASNAPSSQVSVRYVYGFASDIGGGPYARARSFVGLAADQAVPTPNATVQAGLTALSGQGVLEIRDNGIYSETPEIAAAAGEQIEVRAADEMRPVLSLGDDLVISGGDEAEVILNGLWIAGGAVRVTGAVRRVRIIQCTLRPGSDASLIVDAPNAEIEIDSSILGPIRAVNTATVSLLNSIVDATSDTSVAYAAIDGTSDSAPLTVVSSTVIGRVHAHQIDLASNAIFQARQPAPDPLTWPAPVWCERRQEGCVRFSYVPPGSIVPRRFRCRPPDDDDRVRPQFVSLRYGDPGYAQLAIPCAAGIAQGAEDGSEMGVFHDLYQPQREANLRARLQEYLRFGMEAGVFYVG